MNTEEAVFNNRKSEWVKKIIAALILLACAAFVFVEKDAFLRDSSYELPVMDEQQEADFEDGEAGDYFRARQSMKGSVTVRGEFAAETEYLEDVSFIFSNPSPESAKGTVRVTILSGSGEVVGESEKKASSIPHGSWTDFTFGDSGAQDENWIISSGIAGKTEDLRLNRDEFYTIEIASEKVSGKGDTELLMFGYRDGRSGAVTINGKADPSADLWMTMDYHYMGTKLFGLFFAVILFALILVLLPISRMEFAMNRGRRERGAREISLHKILLRGMFFLTPFVCFVISYKIIGLSFSEILDKVHTKSGPLNFFIVALLWLFFYVLTNRMKYSVIFSTLLIGLFSMANYALIQFRDVPLIAADILSARTAFTVMGSYHLTFDKAALYTIVISVVWICIALSLNSWKGPRFRYRLIPILIFLIGAGAFYAVIFQTDMLKDNKIYVNGFKPKITYNKFGYPLSFVMSVKASIVERPEGYSVEEAEKVMSAYSSDEKPVADKTTKETPNIIAIMNESFSDLSILGDLRMNEDPIPYYRSLKKDAIKGTMHSSVFGSMTANTEFEFLTGFSAGFLPFRAIAYNNMIRDEIPSFPENLKRNGYGGNVAFHPGRRISYNRENVYPRLGFDEHIALEDIEKPENIRAFVSDEQDYAIIEEQYESYRRKTKDAPFQLFNVTIQNHGGYLRSGGVVDAGIVIEDEGAATEEAVQFVNLMKKSDLALKQLIGYFSRVKEPTVIVLFGDHQPKLESGFYKSVMGATPSQQSQTEREMRYQVPFLIWANYDIEEKAGVHISANYLAPYLLEQTGGRLTAFDKYLLELKEEIPVITNQGYYDKQRQYHQLDDADSPYADRIREYRMIQYNGLVDRKHRVDEFFSFAEGEVAE